MNIKNLELTMQLLAENALIDFNLGDLVIDGRKIFQMGQVPRNEMPQLRGFPRPNSIASQLPLDKKGKISIQDSFINWMTSVNLAGVHTFTQSPAHLKGSQSELVASKVAKHVIKMLDDPKHKKFTNTYVVDSNNTLLDGHHGWAACRIYELLTGTEVHLKCIKLVRNIDDLIEKTKVFTSVIGIQAKEGL